MAYAEIRCPHCSASGRVENETQSPFMMGRCPVCGGYVVYFCGASLPLDDSVIESHSLTMIRDHILTRIDEFLEERLTEFLEEYADEFEIAHVSSERQAELALEEAHPERPDGYAAPPVDAPRPSIVAPNADAITDDEVADFVRIDLQLIDQARHFDRFFRA